MLVWPDEYKRYTLIFKSKEIPTSANIKIEQTVCNSTQPNISTYKSISQYPPHYYDVLNAACHIEILNTQLFKNNGKNIVMIITLLDMEVSGSKIPRNHTMHVECNVVKTRSKAPIKTMPKDHEPTCPYETSRWHKLDSIQEHCHNRARTHQNIHPNWHPYPNNHLTSLIKAFTPQWLATIRHH